MGLSASQARLLTITSRKSDCEFQSMRLSHEKIALSRSMTDISNEYQNALDQTKLVYDFYGTNDRSLDVSYGLLMQPSEINGYMPIITTDSTGKVVLDSKYAAAARAAGIPAEGLGTLPSNVLRDRFLDGLASSNIITPVASDAYKKVPYSQTIGVGDIETVNEVTTAMTFDDLVKYFDDIQVDLSVGASFNDIKYPTIQKDGQTEEYNHGDEWEMPRGVFKNKDTSTMAQSVSIGDILKGDNQYTLLYKCGIPDSLGDEDYNRLHAELFSYQSMTNYWTQSGNGGYEILQALRNSLSVADPAVQTALNYADVMIDKILNLENNIGDEWKQRSTDFETGALSNYEIGGIAGIDSEWFYGGTSSSRNNERQYMSDANIINNTDNYIGYYIRTARATYTGNSQQASVSIDIGNVLKAYLTYFANAMENFSGKYHVDDEHDPVTVWKDNGQTFQTNRSTVQSSKLVGNKGQDGKVLDFNFDIVVEQTANTSDALMSSFYDAIFNQICLRGWVENNNVTDKNYLQDMYKNGMMFVTSTSDDGYYYQQNYGSFSYIKEVADEEAIARAEAKYNTEKAKLNHKEEMLDLKMKNLDTEISSLTTEYDTIKSLISKNIERGFKRYDA